MDLLKTFGLIAPWLYVGMILFALIGNFLLRRNLAGGMTHSLRTALRYLTLPDEFMSSEASEAEDRLAQGNAVRTKILQREIARFAIMGAAKFAGKTLSFEERQRLAEELLVEANQDPDIQAAAK